MAPRMAEKRASKARKGSNDNLSVQGDFGSVGSVIA